MDKIVLISDSLVSFRYWLYNLSGIVCLLVFILIRDNKLE